MTANIQRAALYFWDIEQSIKKIQIFVHGMTLEKFKDDLKTQDAVHMRLLIIGESIASIQHKCPELLKKYPQIPWREIRGMRNKLAHEYFTVVPDRTWTAVQEDLPILLEAISNIKHAEETLAEEMYRIQKSTA